MDVYRTVPDHVDPLEFRLRPLHLPPPPPPSRTPHRQVARHTLDKRVSLLLPPLEVHVPLRFSRRTESDHSLRQPFEGMCASNGAPQSPSVARVHSAVTYHSPRSLRNVHATEPVDGRSGQGMTHSYTPCADYARRAGCAQHRVFDDRSRCSTDHRADPTRNFGDGFASDSPDTRDHPNGRARNAFEDSSESRKKTGVALIEVPLVVAHCSPPFSIVRFLRAKICSWSSL